MIINVIGLGLIGGSICKALKEYTTHTVYGADISYEILNRAKAQGVIDEILTEDNYAEADVSFICLYPQTTMDFIDNNISAFKKNSIVCDVCGVKASVVEHVTRLTEKHNIRYVGAHPMAGKEFGGYDNSTERLFVGANFIITPVPESDENAVKQIALLAVEMGAGQIIKTSPENHDRIIAYTSQLAHIVSSAYVKSPTIDFEMGYSGGSFQDMTRIATLNEDMWTSLFMLNKLPLICEISTLIENLSEYKASLENCDCDKLKKLLQDGRIIKEKNLLKNPKSH